MAKKAARESSDRDRVAGLNRRLRRLRAVVEAGALTNSTLDLKAIGEHIVSIATGLIGAERGSLFLLDGEKAILTSLVALGVEDGGAITVRVGDGIVGTVASSGRPLILRDPYRDPRFDPSVDTATGFRTRSLLTVPVRDHEGGLVAVLQLLNRRRGTFDREDVGFLSELGVPFALALTTAKLHRVIVERERMRQEMKLAADIQRALRPPDLSVVPGLDLAVVCEPCLEVGGDYYDLIPGADGSWWLVTADISGKGVAAALIASNVQAFLWSRRNSGGSLGDLLGDANNLLYRLTGGLKYATLALAEWRPDVRELRWASAGHLPMLLRRGATIRRLGATGTPLGLIPDLPYGSQTERLGAGDTLLMYTDGVSEAGEGSPQGEFGIEGVERCFAPGETPEAVVGEIAGRLAQHLAGEEAKDDVTLLCAAALP